MMSRRHKLATDLVDLIMEVLPEEVDLQLRRWYKLETHFSFGADGNIYLDDPSLKMVEEDNE